jgi:hypothetical protein
MKALFPKGYDPEAAHGAADDYLVEVLTALGYGKGAQIFKAAEKWYH